MSGFRPVVCMGVRPELSLIHIVPSLRQTTSRRLQLQKQLWDGLPRKILDAFFESIVGHRIGLLRQCCRDCLPPRGHRFGS